MSADRRHRSDPAAAVEETIGYRFTEPDLFVRALTHASVSDEDGKDLERLEFLGDRVLGLLTAETLWRRFPDLPEGELAPRLNALVRKETCAAAARQWKLGPALILSNGEDRSGGREKDAILGDACEALLGALYIDGGLGAARAVYDTFWTDRLDALVEGHRDAKTALQEWAQRHGHGTPRYVDVGREGPDHAPSFTVAVELRGAKGERASGANKQAAQMDAAARVLRRVGEWPDHD